MLQFRSWIGDLSFMFIELNTFTYMSWQHILICFSIYVVIIGGAILLSKFVKNDKHDIILKVLAIVDLFGLIVGFAIIDGFFGDGWMYVLRMDFPLFICSSIHIALPIAAFARGKLKQAMIEFIFVMGFLITITGTILAANYFNTETSIWKVIMNCIIHAAAGLTALYLVLSRRVKFNVYRWVPYALLGSIFILAILTNYLMPLIIEQVGQPNYMFLDNPEGTDFMLFYQWFEHIFIGEFPFGKKVIYPLFHLAINYAYCAAIQLITLLVLTLKNKHYKLKKYTGKYN